jgi:metal-dependent amidase/aminoacylase/carboxypeptidase family protein
MQGTYATLPMHDEKLITENVKRIATKTAEAYGATAEVQIPPIATITRLPLTMLPLR